MRLVAIGAAAAARALTCRGELFVLAPDPAALVVALLLRHRAEDTGLEQPVLVAKVYPARHGR
jgi:hypothetical protein